MKNSPLTNSSRPEEICAFIGTAPRKSFYRWLFLLLLTGALADIGLAVLGLNPMYEYSQRPPFFALSLYALAFAAAFRMIAAGEITLRATSFITFVECHWRLATSLLIGIGI